MHYHCEIIMPPTKDVEKQIDLIMRPFSENEEDSEDYSGHSFWDWYQVGGRWSGAKTKHRLGAKRIQAFCDELCNRKITVSGVQFGKQELSPADQIPEVDALWAEWFPDSGFDACPLFGHAGDQLIGDICEFKDVPLDLPCSRVIIASVGYSDTKEFTAQYMVEDSIWNGVVHQETTWDGTLKHAIERHTEKLNSYTDEAKEKYTIRDDWTVVTIDYHS